MKKNADGSLTLYIQKDSPGKAKESNWLPAPNDTVYLVMRLYWPKTSRLQSCRPAKAPGSRRHREGEIASALQLRLMFSPDIRKLKVDGPDPAMSGRRVLQLDTSGCPSGAEQGSWTSATHPSALYNATSLLHASSACALS